MTCTHHYIIETPSGPTSWGECKLCKETKEFKNFIDPDQGFRAVSTAAKKLQKETLEAKKQEKADHIGLPHSVEP